MPQPTGLQQAHAPYIPPQATGPRGHPGAQQQQQQQQQRQAPAPPMGYEAMRPAMTRPAAPRPAAPAPSPYEDPYGRQQYPGGRPPQPGGGY
jgi:hypothetical protein